VSPGFYARMLARESRAARGRFAFFTACIAVGVAVVVGVAALSEHIDRGLSAHSRELLGGDLAVEARSPLPDVLPLLPAPLRAAQPRHVELCVLSSVVRSASGHSRLAELKAIAGVSDFPLAGVLETTPARPLPELLLDDSVLVARAFLDAGELKPGDTLFVGGQPFRVAGVIEREPDPLGASFVFGPRVLMTRAGLERTQLLALGHRVRYRSLWRFGPGLSLSQLTAAQSALESKLPGGGSYVRVETHAQAQPALRETLERARNYLALLALLTLLIAGAGVAQIVATWLVQVTPQTAILRCLGLRPREVLRLYAAQILGLAALGSALGAGLGALAPRLLGRVYPELAGELHVPWLAMARGVGLGLALSLLFSLPVLISVWKISPSRVLRSDAEPLPVPLALRALSFAALLAGILGAAYFQTESLPRAAAFSCAVAGIAALLWGGARGLLWALGRVPRARVPVLAWHGAAALLRPGSGLVVSCVALGLGNLVVLSIALLSGLMARELSQALPPDAPSMFMLDIQRTQWPDVERLAAAAQASKVEHASVTMARLASVDGRSVEQLVRERAATKSDQDRERWVLTREQRITSTRTLPESNRLIEGRLWSMPDVNEMSVEREFARDLGVRIGSRLTFDVQGVPVPFVVSSLRQVEWRSFSVNFFLVAEPGVLDDAPQFMLGAVRVPAHAEQGLQDGLAQLHPNITVVRVREILERASGLVAQLGIGLRYMGVFGVLVGVIMLAGAVAASQLRRAREVALWKTLGLTRAQIVGMFAVEYGLLGAVSGLISATSAFALTAVFARQVLALSALPSVVTCVLGVLALCALSVLAGLIASARALRSSPLEVLRDPV